MGVWGIFEMLLPILRGESQPGGNPGETPENDLSPPFLGKNPVPAGAPAPPHGLVAGGTDPGEGGPGLAPAREGGAALNTSGIRHLFTV
jgi:hypothetical protein